MMGVTGQEPWAGERHGGTEARKFFWYLGWREPETWIDSNVAGPKP